MNKNVLRIIDIKVQKLDAYKLSVSNCVNTVVSKDMHNCQSYYSIKAKQRVFNAKFISKAIIVVFLCSAWNK